MGSGVAGELERRYGYSARIRYAVGDNMSSQQLDEEAIFYIARRIDESAVRTDYLDQVCAGDAQLRKRVDALLEPHEQESQFLKSRSDPEATVDQPSLDDATGQQIGPYKFCGFLFAARWRSRIAVALSPL